MGRLVENLWDCPYCYTKGIGGSRRECPNCGKPRGDYTRFYMPGEITYISEEQASKINRNPDWLCEFCGSLNSDSDTTCKSCGSTRTTENKDYFSIRQEEKSSTDDDSNFGDENSLYNTSGNIESHNNEAIPWEENESFVDKVIGFFKNKWKFFLIGTLALAFVIGMIFLLIPKTKEVTITGFEWERSISIERYQTVNESDWNLPSGGRLKYTHEEIYEYKRMLDHYETRSRQVTKQRITGYEDYVVGYRNLGNGYSEKITEQRPVYETYTETEYYQEPIYKQVPIYKTKYYYEIDKWIYDRSLKTSGKDKEPYWEETNSLTNKEREAGRTEKYYIIGFDIKTNDKTEKISVPYETWKELNENQKVKMKVSIFGEGELIE